MDSVRSFWNDLPALRILLPYLLGILAAITYVHFLHDPELVIANFKLIITLALSATILSIFILLFFYFNNNPATFYRYRFVNGFAIQLALFFMGIVSLLMHTSIKDKNHLYWLADKSGVYVVNITNPPVKKEKTIVAQADLVADETGKRISGNILLMMPKNSNSLSLNYGDQLLISGKPEWLSKPKNPYEFDYAQFQHFRNNYYRIYLPDANYRLIKHSQGNAILSTIFEWRKYFISELEKHLETKDERAIAGAILLGYRDEMTQDVIQAYASSGALHVMSVSGLHVGIMFLALQFLLGWMDRRGKWLSISKTFLIILLLLGYAVITDLAPSVMRAVVMFSLFTIGKTFNRNTNMFNILAVTCLILLIINPYLITEVGFKLSFLAVIGIVTLYQIFYKLLVIRNEYLNFIWSITCVSVAAQLATFPIGLYYFHQFPNLFIISNLVVIPVSNIIIYMGMLLFAVAKISWLSEPIGVLLYLLVFLINKFIFWIEQVPYALIQAIHISQSEMYLMYLIFIVALLYYFIPKSKYALLGLSLLLLLVTVRTIRTLSSENTKSLIVYHVPKQTAISVIENNKAYSILDSSLAQNRSKMLFHIFHHWWALGISESDELKDYPAEVKPITLPFGELHFIGNKKVLFINQPIKNLNIDQKIHLDEVIISGNKNIAMSALKKYFVFDKVVFDTSNKKWRVEKWKAECEQLNLPYHDVASGAYIADLY